VLRPAGLPKPGICRVAKASRVLPRRTPTCACQGCKQPAQSCKTGLAAFEIDTQRQKRARHLSRRKSPAPTHATVEARGRLLHRCHMNPVPLAVAAFLAGKRLAVAGVSRFGDQPANAILRKLRDCGFDAIPVNPHADRLEGATCYRDLAAVPGVIDGLMVVTHPDVADDIVRQAAARGIRQIWFHRSFGQGSVSAAGLRACAELGIHPIVGGCPLMYCEPVDVAHRCFRWWLGRQGRIPV